ncbi:hypothetical protein AAMO2058_000985900 [Amorphochlora amoebiformis]
MVSFYPTDVRIATRLVLLALTALANRPVRVWQCKENTRRTLNLRGGGGTRQSRSMRNFWSVGDDARNLHPHHRGPAWERRRRLREKYGKLFPDPDASSPEDKNYELEPPDDDGKSIRRAGREYRNKVDPNWTLPFPPRDPRKREPWKYKSIKPKFNTSDPSTLFDSHIVSASNLRRMFIEKLAELKISQKKHLRRIRIETAKLQQRRRDAKEAKVGFSWEKSPYGNTTTWAGAGWGNRDGPRDKAKFSYPCGVHMEGDGSILVADTGNHAIRKIHPDGYVTTLAGTHLGFGLRDGPASQAEFRQPRGVYRCANGDILVADSGNHVIRKISTDGDVTSYAGDTQMRTWRKPGDPDSPLKPSFGSIDGQLHEARFNFPVQVTVDPTSDRILILEAGQGKVREIIERFPPSPLQNGGMDDPAIPPKFWKHDSVCLIERGNVGGRRNVVRVRSHGFLDAPLIQSRIFPKRKKVGVINPAKHDLTTEQLLEKEENEVKHHKKGLPSMLVFANATGKKNLKEIQKQAKDFENKMRVKEPLYHVFDQNKLLPSTKGELPQNYGALGGIMRHMKERPPLPKNDKAIITFSSANSAEEDSDEHVIGKTLNTREKIWSVNEGRYRHLQLRSANGTRTNISSSHAFMYQTLTVEPGEEYEIKIDIFQASRIPVAISKVIGSDKPFPPDVVLKKAYVYVVDGYFQRIQFCDPIVKIYPKRVDRWHSITGRFTAKGYRATIVLFNKNFQMTYFDNVNVRKVVPKQNKIYDVRTIAGSGIFRGNPLYCHQDGLAREASFAHPMGFDFSKKGDLYICDSHSPESPYLGNMIRVVGKGYSISPGKMAKLMDRKLAKYRNGSLSPKRGLSFVNTLAGGIMPGQQDGPFTHAMFCNPQGLKIDRHGAIVVADTGNSRIRRISPKGHVTTLAGWDRQEMPEGYVDGVGWEARFSRPCGVAISPDNSKIYIADTNNHRIREIRMSKAGYVMPERSNLTICPCPMCNILNQQNITTLREETSMLNYTTTYYKNGERVYDRASGNPFAKVEDTLSQALQNVSKKDRGSVARDIDKLLRKHRIKHKGYRGEHDTQDPIFGDRKGVSNLIPRQGVFTVNISEPGIANPNWDPEIMPSSSEEPMPQELLGLMNWPTSLPEPRTVREWNQMKEKVMRPTRKGRLPGRD